MRKIQAFLLLSLISIFSACNSIKPIMNNTPTSQSPVSLSEIYKPYSYAATVVDVYDGDTFTLDFEIGFGLTFEDVIRLARIDTPELRGDEREEGKKVRNYVEKLILSKKVIAVTEKDDRGKYGRLIAEIYFHESGCDCWSNLTDLLLSQGMGEEY